MGREMGREREREAVQSEGVTSYFILHPQNTSVISPVVSMLVLAPVSFLYFSMSPSPLTSHCLLFISATCLPTVKIVIAIIVSGERGEGGKGGERKCYDCANFFTACVQVMQS